ncbi:lytic transglycosylase [Paracoccus luteus]|uniref:lytic transglycosylase n=1 Tax=Paracoccus luteus TaxID=2508543 RepID=UPI00106FD844|nr:lytic transglycosylase [Paracoccus luteus]
MRGTITAALAAMALAGCGVSEAARQATTAPTIAGAESRPLSDRLTAALPWGNAPAAQAAASNGSDAWTQAALQALNDEGVTLLSTVPSDVMQFCPGYAAQTRENRAAFWAGLLSAVARHDAGTKAAGGNRRSGQSGGCGAGLLDGADGLQCAVRNVARQVARDGAIAGGSGGWRGAARDWLPLRSQGSRDQIAGWTRKQSYCK